MAWNKLKFFWENGLAALTATSTESGHDVDNLFKMREDTFWKATSSADQNIDYDAGVGFATNGDYEVGDTSGWTITLSGGAAATHSASATDVYEGSWRGGVVITDGGSAVTNIRLYTSASFSVVKGKSYTVIFAMKAAAGRTIEVNVQMDNTPFTSYGLAEEVTLTSSWQVFPYTFIANVTADDARLSFSFGSDTNNIFIDAVSVGLSKYYTADYLAIAGHNLNTGGGTYRLIYSHDDFSTPVDALAATTPTTDKAIVSEFTQVSARWWRLSLEGHSVASSMAIAIWGPKTELDYASVSFDPEGQKIHSNVNVSQAGYIAGIHERFRERNINLRLNNVDAFGTIHTDLKRWFDDHGQQLLFLGWETGEHAAEIWLVRNNGVRSWPLTSGGLYRSINLSLTGRVE